MVRKLMSSPSTHRKSGKLLRRKARSRRRNNIGRNVDLGMERLEPRLVLASPGSLDTTFDPADLDGVLIGNLGLPSTANVRFNAVTTQADGKIVAAGYVDLLSNNAHDFLVARFNTDGSLDTTFGVDGADADSLPDGFITFDFNVSGDSSNGQDVAIDSMGRIVVVGDGPNASELDSWTVARLTSSGLLDSSFGTGGKVTTSWSAGTLNFGAQAHSVAIQSDNKIVVAGDVRTSSSFTEFDFGVVRYNTDGTLDSTFGTGGKVQTDFFGARDIANGVAIQSDGKIVAAGYATHGTQNFAMARFDTNGVLDPTFGTGGKVDTDIVPTGPAQDNANSIAIQSDGKILLGGFTANGNDFVAARYLSTGILDTTFNPVPSPSLSSAPGTLRINFGQTDIARAVAVQVDGQYVIAGSASLSSGHDNDTFALGRVDTTGSLDSTFGTGGKVQTRISDFIPGTIGVAIGTDMTLQPDGKILEVGYLLAPDGHEKFVMARYESGVVVQSIAGPADTNEGDTYTLTLASGDPTTTQWTINWGDSVQTVPGNPTSVTHVYADGDASYTIQRHHHDQHWYRSRRQHRCANGPQRRPDARHQRRCGR